MNKRIFKKQRRGPWMHHAFKAKAAIIDHPPRWPAFSQLLDDVIALSMRSRG